MWCLGGCDRRIAQGVRFNADKKQIGKYYSTPILRFTMKCERCAGELVIDTDPEHSDFKVISGCRKRDAEAGVDESLILESKTEEEEPLLKDPMYRLEHGLEDLSKATQAKPLLERLQDRNAPLRDDYALLTLARRPIREANRAREAEEAEAQKNPLKVVLAKLTDADRSALAAAKFARKGDPVKLSAVDLAKKRLLKQSSASIFGPPQKRPKT